MYVACMANVQVRDVPADVHEALVRKAAEAGQSLQQFLSARLAEIARRPSRSAVLDRIAGREATTVTDEQILAALDAGRAGR